MKTASALLLVVLLTGPAFATGELEPEAPASPKVGAGEAVAPVSDAASPTGEAAAPVSESVEAGAPPDEPESSAPASAVSRAGFTTAILDREPVDQIQSLTADHDRVFFFTELWGMQDQTITHRWEFRGQVMAEVPFAVRGPRWRIYSSKRLLPGWTGGWTATVVDASGRVLARRQLEFVPVETAGAGGTPAPTPAAGPQTGEDEPPPQEQDETPPPTAPDPTADEPRFRPSGAPTPGGPQRSAP